MHFYKWIFVLVALSLVQTASSEAQPSNVSVGSSSSQSLSSSPADCGDAGALMSKALAQRSNPTEAEKLLREAAAHCPHMAEIQYNLGVLLDEQSKWEDAAGAFHQALEVRDDARYRVALGSVLVRKGDLIGAKAEFQKAQELSPRLVTALQGLAVVFDKEGKPDQALDTLTRARELEESNALTHFNLGTLYERSNQLDAASMSYQKAAQLNPKYADAFLRFGAALLRQEKFQDAESNLRRAADLMPKSAEPYRALGSLYEKQDDLPKAELAFRGAVERDPKDMQALLNLATIQVLLKRAQNALETVDKALALENDNALALRLKGWASMDLGKIAEAEALLSKAIEKNSASAAGYYALGILYEQKGESSRAQSQFEVASKLRPSIMEGEKSVWRLWD